MKQVFAAPALLTAIVPKRLRKLRRELDARVAAQRTRGRRSSIDR
jgi:hypothetical protein